MLVALALLILLWLIVRLDRSHGRAMTDLHASYRKELGALRAEVAGHRLTGGSGGR